MPKEIYPQKEFSTGKRVIVDLNQSIHTLFPHLPTNTLNNQLFLPDHIVCLPLPDVERENFSLFFRSEPCPDREVVKLPNPTTEMEYMYYNTDNTPHQAMDHMLERYVPFGIVYDNMLTFAIMNPVPQDIQKYLTMAKNLLVKDGIFALQLPDSRKGENILALEQVSTVFGAPEFCKLYQIAQSSTDTGVVWIFRKIDNTTQFGLYNSSQEENIPDYKQLLRRGTL